MEQLCDAIQRSKNIPNQFAFIQITKYDTRMLQFVSICLKRITIAILIRGYNSKFLRVDA